jgi:multicomponent Na+:H+ antiporter subunit A
MWAGPVTLGVLGVVFGLLTPLTGTLLIAPATSAIVGEITSIKLVLWHGINRELLLSVLTLGLGVAALALAGPLGRVIPKLAPLASFGPERGYAGSLNLLNVIASFQTRILQNGYLRIYIEVILAFVLLTAGWTFVRTFTWTGLPELTPIRFNDAIIVLIIVLSIIGAVASRSRMAAIASLGVTGYAVAIFFVLYSAPDLAMTQMVIETLTVILIVLAFYHLPAFRGRSSSRSKLRDVAISAMVGALFASLTLAANVANLSPPISRFYSEESWTSAYGKNIVNVILVDFRALDTLGEIAVLMLAGIGAMALLKLKMGKAPPRSAPPRDAPTASSTPPGQEVL